MLMKNSFTSFKKAKCSSKVSQASTINSIELLASRLSTQQPVSSLFFWGIFKIPNGQLCITTIVRLRSKLLRDRIYWKYWSKIRIGLALSKISRVHLINCWILMDSWTINLMFNRVQGWRLKQKFWAAYPPESLVQKAKTTSIYSTLKYTLYSCV